MILDRLENWKLYFREEKLIVRAFEFLQNEFDPSLPDGRLEIDGDRIYAALQGYETRPLDKCRFEVHRRYFDIQLMVEGSEIIGWTPRKQLTIEEPFVDEKDVEFLLHPKRFSSLELNPGDFAFFFPDDAHAPGIRQEESKAVRKIVVKILVS